MKNIAWIVAVLLAAAGGLFAGYNLSRTAAPEPVTIDPDDAENRAFGALSADAQTRLAACGVGPDGLDALLEMDARTFDQDFEGGWRAIDARDGCGIAAADVIKTYILFARPHAPERELSLLRWHAGQALADAGETAQALLFFRGSYEAGPEQSDQEWNLYVDGTIAFLERNRDALQSARDRLAGFEVSEEERAARQAFLDANPRISMPDGFVDEPSNLSVLDDFLACFDRSYGDAYGRACTH